MGKGAHVSWSRHWKTHRIKTARQWKDGRVERFSEKGYCLVHQCGYRMKGNTWEWSKRAQTASLGNFVYWYPTTTLESMWCDTQWDSRTLGKSMYLLLSPRINSITALGKKKILSSLKAHYSYLRISRKRSAWIGEMFV